MPFGRLPTLVWKKDPSAKPLPRVFAKRPDPPPPVPDQVAWKPIEEAVGEGPFWVRNGVRSGWACFKGKGWVPDWDPQPTAYLHGKSYD